MNAAQALYDEEEEYYAATVQKATFPSTANMPKTTDRDSRVHARFGADKDNGDGTFDIVWEEDDCEYMQRPRVAP